MDAKILGDRVHMERRTLKINQDELARRANISRTYVSEIENCIVPNPSVDVIFALSEALKVSVLYLLGLSSDPLGEDLGPSEREGRIVHQVATPDQYQRIQQVLEIFDDLTPEAQLHALSILDTFRRAQRVRIVGGDS